MLEAVTPLTIKLPAGLITEKDFIVNCDDIDGAAEKAAAKLFELPAEPPTKDMFDGFER